MKNQELTPITSTHVTMDRHPGPAKQRRRFVYTAIPAAVTETILCTICARPLPALSAMTCFYRSLLPAR
jgi:hypothetical protein